MHRSFVPPHPERALSSSFREMMRTRAAESERTTLPRHTHGYARSAHEHTAVRHEPLHLDRPSQPARERPLSTFACTAHIAVSRSLANRALVAGACRSLELTETAQADPYLPAARPGLPSLGPPRLLRPLLADGARPVARQAVPPPRRAHAHLHLWPRLLAGQAPAVEARPHRPARPQAPPGPGPPPRPHRVRPALLHTL